VIVITSRRSAVENWGMISAPPTAVVHGKAWVDRDAGVRLHYRDGVVSLATVKAPFPGTAYRAARARTTPSDKEQP
jgi:hypothetical protein